MLGEQAFCNSKSTRIEGIQWDGACELLDLPNLQTINLGWCALNGRAVSDCSLVMRSKT